MTSATMVRMGIAERRPIAAALVVSALVALAMVAPFAAGGTSFGHDIGSHIDAWADAAQSWRAGILFPRWAELANGKYGEPRFIFYPPISWMLGAALSFLLPWKMVPGAFVFLALTLAGVTMFRLAREYLPTPDALLAGALYAANPYHMLAIHQRSAYAELLAGALFPLVLLFALRLPRERWRGVAPLALVCAAMWLTNSPAALLASYALLLLLLVMAWRERSPAPFAFGCAALGIGLMLAAVYIVPAVVEQPWVRIHDALAGGRDVDSNFLFASIADPLRLAFNQMVSTVAVVAMLLLALAAWSTRARPASLAAAWWPVVVLGVVASALMVRASAALWHVAPQAQFLQFPWRWLVVLGPCLVLLMAAAMAAWRNKALGWVVVAVGLLLAAQFIVERSWQVSGGTEILVNEALTAGYEGSDEYAPLATEHRALVQELPAASVVAADGSLSDAHARVEEWRPEVRRISVTTEKPEQVVMRMVSYPAWRVEVNGRLVETTARARTGEIVVPVAAGQSDIRVRFARTRDRTVGGWLSLVGVLVVGLIAGMSRRATSKSR